MEEVRRDTGIHPRAKRRLTQNDWIAWGVATVAILGAFFGIMRYVFFEKTDALVLETKFKGQVEAQDKFQTAITGKVGIIEQKLDTTNETVIRMDTKLDVLMREQRRSNRRNDNE